jgi:L-2-hydroxyglutarate oxidase LhgO
MPQDNKTDYLIIGAGIMGLAIARELRTRHSDVSIIIIEKERDVAAHASGRNSGVLHAGFYYSPDSLKAKFCREGNAAMRKFVTDHRLRINDCGKVVVAQNEEELQSLKDLYERGIKNGVRLQWIDEEELKRIEPNAKSFRNAIFSPTTAIVDPVEVCQAMRKELQEQGVTIVTDTLYEKRRDRQAIVAGGKIYEARHVINCAGVYADRIARDFGFSQHYSIMPFKGVYLEYKGEDKPFTRCIYPVPNKINRFLGVHTSVTVDGRVKIGPTATPVFGRENYQGMKGIVGKDLLEIVCRNAGMLLHDARFRHLAWEEMHKYVSPAYMVDNAAHIMQKPLDPRKFVPYRPGIRAQLMDDRTRELLEDFVVEGDDKSTHVLNAVSPAFTSSIPFAKWIVENHCAR